MKIEIARKEGIVEVRLVREDGTVSAWACPTDEAAMFLAASLLYGKKPEEGRSILLGEFEEKGKAPAEAEISKELLKKLQEAILGEGLAKKVAPIVPQEPSPVPFPSYPNFPNQGPIYVQTPWITWGTGTGDPAITTTVTSATTSQATGAANVDGYSYISPGAVTWTCTYGSSK